MHATSPLQVFRATAEVLEPHGPAVHVEHTVTFLSRGWIELECGERARAQAGCMVFVPAGVPHRFHGGGDVAYSTVGFCGSCLGFDESEPLMEPYQRVRRGGLPVTVIPEARHAWVESLFDELARAEWHGSDGPVSSLLSLLLREGASPAPLPHPRGGDSLVSQALLFIQRHACEPISLRDVAAAVFRSPAHVATTVKHATGHTVGEWITAQRVAEAARWLSHTDLGLDAVAERVGWRDKTHFIRMFKRARGVTPAAWRRESRHPRHASIEGASVR